MMVSRRNLPAPKVIENGVVVSSGGQINEMTLAEHQRYLVDSKHRQLSRDESEQIYGLEEVQEYFGLRVLSETTRPVMLLVMDEDSE